MTCLKREPRGVPARPSQALYYPLLHHTPGHDKHDWDGLGRLFRGHDRRCAARGNDYINACSHQVSRKPGQSLWMTFRIAELHDEVSTFDVPKLAEPLAERGFGGVRGRGGGLQKANSPHLLRLLRLADERRG